MKKFIFVLVSVGIVTGAFAQDAPPAQEITKQIIRSVTDYANSISCEDGEVSPKNIAALVPYKTSDDRWDEKYAVIWTGDIGCSGGSHSSTANLSIVTIGSSDSYVVDPLKSSPVIKFECPVQAVERVVGNTSDSLVLEGNEVGPDDASCCPSVKVRFTLRADEKGNWKLADKKILPSKK